MTKFDLTPSQRWAKLYSRYDGPIPAGAKRAAEQYERDWYANQAAIVSDQRSTAAAANGANDFFVSVMGDTTKS